MTGPQDHCARTGDAGLYVLDELDGRRQESFARHLRRCAACAEEVELLQQAAEAVPLLAARHVPVPDEAPQPQRVPSLAVAVANARPAQAGASAGDAAADQAQAGSSRPREQERVVVKPKLRPIQGGAAADRVKVAPRSGGRRVLRTPMPTSAIVGFLALAIIAVATVALTHRAATTHYVRIPAGWSRGGAALKLEGNELELLVEGMPKLAHGHGYEIWLVDRSTKKLEPTNSWLHLNRVGEDGVSVPGDYHDWEAIAVYVEPLHGRHTTRSGAVIVGDLRNQGR